ncbi:cupin domain-containing protein [Micromonospora sp. CA-246542]|uniref:cupin domain-containing protein n=1 Tax=Micromonospora sp. CA-246542 TaxID=3239959 RepID=UPI003D8B7100
MIEESMPPGTTETWHVHDQARQFFYILEGNAEMLTADRRLSLPAGSGVQISTGTPHRIANSSEQMTRFLVVSAPRTRFDRRPCNPLILPGTAG